MRYFCPRLKLFEFNSQSYGGFMSCKVVEADAGVHSLAMAVAVRTLTSQCRVCAYVIL